MILDIPRFKCFIRSEYLSGGSITNEYVEAYCFSVTIIESRVLLWTVHTIDGAVYSRLPTYAICHNIPENKAEHKLDIFGAISSNGQVIEHEYLKDYMVEVNIDGKKYPGVYAFTIDYFTGGFAQDPEQHKTSNVIFMDSGYIFVGPNNMMLFIDSHFTDNKKPSFQYRRNKNYYYLQDE